jgi:N-acetylmuramoyl-L-alanine amidase
MPLEPSGVRFLVVHCSASQPNAKPPVTAAVIDRWHRERGFRKIGYHFVIRRDGVVEPGRTLDEIGAHVEGFNAVSVGVCLAGGVDANLKPEDNFTSQQKDVLAKLLAGLLQKFPKAEIVGHRDLPNVKKDCPSFDVKSWWAKVNNI